MTTPGRLTSRLWDWPVSVDDDGLYSATFKHLFDNPMIGVDAMVDYGQIEQGLAEILGLQVSGFKSDPISNTYTAEMKERVSEIDGPLAELLGYDRPFALLPRPVRWGGVA
jgi:hypothetical protein